LWTLEELGAEYAFHPVDLMKGEHRGAEYLAINPNGKVPALKHGDLVLWESSAICTYIAGLAPDAGLVPPEGTADRALYDQWVSFATTELEQPLWTIAKHTFALPEKMHVEAMKAVGGKEFRRPLEILANSLQDRDVLVGDSFTVPDILAAHTLSWARNADIPLEHEAVESYLKRHTKRPAYRRAIKKHLA
jgi:glutathione S-transferase